MRWRGWPPACRAWWRSSACRAGAGPGAGGRELVFALDADAAGPPPWRALARQAALRGKCVAVLEPAAYGGHKDVNEAWMAGELTVGDWPASAGEGSPRLQVPADRQETWAERVAIMVADGGLPSAQAERLAWAGLQTPGEAQ